MWEYLFLAKDRETGMIVDDGFMMFTRKKREDMAFFMQQHCNERDLDLIDFDGPFRLLHLFGWSRRRGKPKWAEQRPQNIAADEWEKRLKSHGEREAYWAGLEAGRNERIKG
jgi:hypothetical protein